jgi:hypothetical protein
MATLITVDLLIPSTWHLMWTSVYAIWELPEGSPKVCARSLLGSERVSNGVTLRNRVDKKRNDCASDPKSNIKGIASIYS